MSEKWYSRVRHIRFTQKEHAFIAIVVFRQLQAYTVTTVYKQLYAISVCL